MKMEEIVSDLRRDLALEGSHLYDYRHINVTKYDQ